MAKKTAKQPAQFKITEVVDFQGKVDEKAGLVRDVKVLGIMSLNGRRYTEQALNSAVRIYEGGICRIDHDKTGGSRNYASRFGTFENVRKVPGVGVIADHRYNPEHALTKTYLHDANNRTQAIGFSPAHTVSMKREGKENVVTEIHKLDSIDLVDTPATARTIFEDANTEAIEGELEESEGKTVKALILECVAAKPESAKLYEDFLADPIVCAVVVEAADDKADDPAACLSSAFGTMIQAHLDDKDSDADAKKKKIGQLVKAHGAAFPPDKKDDDTMSKEQIEKMEAIERRMLAHEVLATAGVSPKPEVVAVLVKESTVEKMTEALAAIPPANKGEKVPRFVTERYETEGATVTDWSKPVVTESFCESILG